jgi:hypothetical protein
MATEKQISSKATKLRRAYVFGALSIDDARQILVRDGWHGDRLDDFLIDTMAVRNKKTEGYMLDDLDAINAKFAARVAAEGLAKGAQ